MLLFKECGKLNRTDMINIDEDIKKEFINEMRGLAFSECLMYEEKALSILKDLEQKYVNKITKNIIQELNAELSRLSVNDIETVIKL